MITATFTGPDRPGISHAISQSIARYPDVQITDMGQAALGGWLSLTLSIQVKKGAEKLKTELFKLAQERDLNFEWTERTSDANPPNAHRYVLTLIGNPISSTGLEAVTQLIAGLKLNIDRINQLSKDGFNCLEMHISSPVPVEIHELKEKILSLSQDHAIDLALQKKGLFRRSKRLVVFDMDSTLIENEIIDEFARKLGVYDQVASITHQAMEGKLDFNQALKKRCEMLKGLTTHEMNEVYESIQLTHGARELIRILKILGLKTAVLSGGFDCVVNRVKDDLGIDYAYSNSLEMRGGVATGQILPPIVNAERKAQLLEMIALQENISLEQVIAIGDGANDLPMLGRAGLGIAFNAKHTVQQQARYSINYRDLRAVLYLLGLSERDWKDHTG